MAPPPRHLPRAHVQCAGAASAATRRTGKWVSGAAQPSPARYLAPSSGSPPRLARSASERGGIAQDSNVMPLRHARNSEDGVRGGSKKNQQAQLTDSGTKQYSTVSFHLVYCSNRVNTTARHTHTQRH